MSTQVEQEFIDIVATEMASGVCEAVGHWMAEIDSILKNEDCTARQKLAAIESIVSEYKTVSHHRELRPRTARFPARPSERSCGAGI